MSHELSKQDKVKVILIAGGVISVVVIFIVIFTLNFLNSFKSEEESQAGETLVMLKGKRYQVANDNSVSLEDIEKLSRKSLLGSELIVTSDRAIRKPNIKFISQNQTDNASKIPSETKRTIESPHHYEHSSDKKEINYNALKSDFIYVKPSNSSFKEVLIKSGDQFNAVLLQSAINIDDDTAVLASMPWKNGHNVTLIGLLKTLPNKDRLYFYFKRLILPSGEQLPISAYGIGSDGEQGLKAIVESNVDADILKSLATGALAFSSLVLDQSTAGLGSTVLSSATQKSINDIETRRVLSVKKNTRFKIFFIEPVLGL